MCLCYDLSIILNLFIGLARKQCEERGFEGPCFSFENSREDFSGMVQLYAVMLI
jgi:hypothetical protein